jgi:hypothetical protein
MYSSHQPPDVLLWASILKNEELLGKSGSRVGGVNKKPKSDGLHLVRISTFSFQLLQYGHKGNGRVLTHGWKDMILKLTHCTSGKNLNVITVL